jgi:hypothetical protein
MVSLLVQGNCLRDGKNDGCGPTRGYEVSVSDYHLFSFDSLHLNFLLLLGQGSEVFPPHFPAAMRAEFVSHHNILHSKLIMLIALNEQYKS